MPHPVLEVLQEVALVAPGPDLPLAEKLCNHAPDALLDEIPERYARRRVAPRSARAESYDR